VTHPFTNSAIVNILKEVEAAMVVKGENRFRIRAYENAIAVIDNMGTQVQSLWRSNKLTEIPGIGANLASHLNELFTKGKVGHFTRLKKGLPDGMFELLKVEGIGPKTAHTLAKEFKLTSRKSAVSKLIVKAKRNRIAPLENFGEKSQEQILQALKKYNSQGEKKRLPLAQADGIVSRVLNYMEGCSQIAEISPLGSFRRRVETVGDIDIGIATKEPEKVVAFIKKYPNKQKIGVAGEGVVRIIDEHGVQIDFKLENPSRWGSLLLHFTGSKQHNVALRELAIKQGKSMSEQGMKIKNKWVRFSSEEAFYKNLGLTWIPPELRENEGEIEAAKEGKLPELVELTDIKGDLHTHTNHDWVSSHDSGANKPEEIIRKALKLGYEYVGVGDHNPSNSGYSDSKIISLIKARNNKFDQIKSIYEKGVKNRSIKVFNTLEVDIKSNGDLALPDEGLKYLDFLVVSIHSAFSISSEEMTNRVLKALSHPKVKVFGHPTARLIGKRESIQLDWDKVFGFCKKENVALEINANPKRLDLPDILVKLAIKQGVKLVINTDTHDLPHMDFMQFGVDVAKRGWATGSDIVNTWSVDKFEKWIKN
jgi:DNA polymerase (family 10)